MKHEVFAMDVAIVSSSPQGGAQASKFGFYKLIECIINKMSWCETECKKNVALVKQNVMKF